jgi:hypothetical protein
MVGDPAGTVNVVSEVLLDESKCPLPVWVSALGESESAVVNPPFSVAVQECKAGVKHLMVEDEADDVFGNEGVVEPPVEDDSVMGWIVMAQSPSALGDTPPQLVDWEGIVKEIAVEGLEESIEVKNITGWRKNPLATALSAQ